MRSVFLIVYMKLFLWNPLLLFTGDILQGVLLRTEWTVTKKRKGSLGKGAVYGEKMGKQKCR